MLQNETPQQSPMMQASRLFLHTQVPSEPQPMVPQQSPSPEQGSPARAQHDVAPPKV